MLVSDVQNRIVKKIGLNSTEAVYVLDWLAEGYRDLIDKTHFYISSTTIAITAGVVDYQLATTIDAIDDVTIDGSLVKPDQVTREQILDMRRYANAGTTQGDVYSFCIYGNLLQIYPNPTANTTMTIYYVASPTTSAFVGSEDLVADLHMIPLGPLSKALEYYGLWQASEYDDKAITENSMGYLSEYDKFVIEAKKAVRRRSARGLRMATIGYPVRRGFPRRNDVYPTVSRWGS